MNDRRPVWPWITTSLLGLPVLYILSFGPACWISERLGKGTGQVSAVYRPVIWLGNRLPLGTELMSQYARLGAGPDRTPDFSDNQLSWVEYIGPGPRSLKAYTVTVECQFGETEDESSGENDGDDNTSVSGEYRELGAEDTVQSHETSLCR